MAGALGLVGGAGALPVLMMREARREGWRVIAFALDDPASLQDLADVVVPCRLGEVGPVLEALTREGIRHVVLAGRVWKDGLFQGGALDEAGRALLGRSPDWSDEGLLRRAASALEAMGIELLDQRRFLAPWLAPSGRIAGPFADARVRGDIERGVAVARQLAEEGIGQTVVVRAGTIVAVEAMEGTDEAVRRGLTLAGPGAVVVKATGPSHDYRFDVPTVGRATLMLCIRGGAAALAVEAGRVLLMDREAVQAEAERVGVSVVGVTGNSGIG